jgi:threonine/homoserine/homoserine lactone efflux protein
MTRLGLAIVMTRVPQAFVGVRYAGCAYLLWLGGRSLWRAIRPPATEPSAAVADGVAFGQGFITNILNPSIFTYYVVVVPSFMPAGTGTSRYVLLASLHISIAFACHNAWSGLFNQIGHLMRSPRARRAFDTLAGVALTGLAIRLLA